MTTSWMQVPVLFPHPVLKLHGAIGDGMAFRYFAALLALGFSLFATPALAAPQEAVFNKEGVWAIDIDGGAKAAHGARGRRPAKPAPSPACPGSSPSPSACSRAIPRRRPRG